MNRNEIRSELEDVVGGVLDRRIILDDTTRPSDIEGWDSLAHVTIVVSAERKFGVRFTAKEIADASTVDELVRLIESKRIE